MASRSVVILSCTPIPTLTPVLTPVLNPTPTFTPTLTLTPVLTPTPTLTPFPTLTRSPSNWLDHEQTKKTESVQSAGSGSNDVEGLFRQVKRFDLSHFRISSTPS